MIAEIIKEGVVTDMKKELNWEKEEENGREDWLIKEVAFYFFFPLSPYLCCFLFFFSFLSASSINILLP